MYALLNAAIYLVPEISKYIHNKAFDIVKSMSSYVLDFIRLPKGFVDAISSFLATVVASIIYVGTFIFTSVAIVMLTINVFTYFIMYMSGIKNINYKVVLYSQLYLECYWE
jgi:hypothetical protein